MKPIRRHFLGTAVIVLFVSLAPGARAFYNPSTGRWLSRDPKGEEPGCGLYAFVRNNVANKLDYLGLEETSGGIPHVSNDRHQNYLSFKVSCPKGFKVSNVSVEYDHGMWDEMYQWFLANANYFLVTPDEDAYVSLVQQAMTLFGGSRDLGGYQGPPDYTPRRNCDGDPVEEHAYMRTRLVSPGKDFVTWRENSLVPDPSITIPLYVKYTKLKFTCICCPKQQHAASPPGPR